MKHRLEHTQLEKGYEVQNRNQEIMEEKIISETQTNLQIAKGRKEVRENKESSRHRG